MRILVVDDEPMLRSAVVTALEVEGFETIQAANGDEALQVLAGISPDVIVLDWMMPGVDGIALCRMLRSAGDRTPILLLTARSQVTDRVAGLDAGADDYLAKPFALEELTARVRALLRRSLAELPEVLTFADLTLDTSSRTGSRGGREIEFTRTEFTLLELFLTNPGQVLTREVIVDRVWGADFGPTSNSLAVYISYLRVKLEGGGEERLIHTVRGAGYRLD